MEKNKISLTKILLNNNRVNNYTKLLIILSQLDFYKDYYIPNAKLMKMLNINKKRVICLLNQLKEDKIIAVFYENKKRYFNFIGYYTKSKNFNNDEIEYIESNTKLFDYNWLEEN